jgi:hypothetical protein
MPAYDTVTDALNDLKLRGFTTDFNIAFDKLQCSKTNKCLSPSEFEIVEHYRFEGNSDPADESTVYAVAAKDGSMRGVLVTAYGAYTDGLNDELIRKLSVNE